jgi:hypothetical protein
MFHRSLVEHLGNFLLSHNSKFVLQTLKFAAKLLELNYLPRVVHDRIVSHIFAFPKLMDSPFAEGSRPLLSHVVFPIDDDVSASMCNFVIGVLATFRDSKALAFASQHCPMIWDCLWQFIIIRKSPLICENSIDRRTCRSSSSFKYSR